MKWYKHDPSAALAGMIGLTIEERGAYYTLIDLCYARAPKNYVTDVLVAQALGCRPQVWRRLKASLIAKGKVREVLHEDGNTKLLPNRVESEVVSAEFLSSNMARLGKLSALKRREHNELASNASLRLKLNGAGRDNQNKKERSSLEWRDPAGASDKKASELSRGDLEAIYAAKPKQG